MYYEIFVPFCVDCHYFFVAYNAVNPKCFRDRQIYIPGLKTYLDQMINLENNYPSIFCLGVAGGWSLSQLS